MTLAAISQRLTSDGTHPPGGRRSRRPREVMVSYRGIEYRIDLARCRRALVDRQVAGRFDTMESLAGAVGISRSTASRFFSGRPTSLAVTLKLLSALGLRFDEVARLHSDGEDPDDGAGAGARMRPVSGGPRTGPQAAAV